MVRFWTISSAIFRRVPAQTHRVEREADPTRLVTFDDQRVTPKPDEQVVEAAYAGYDNRGRVFRFAGFVTAQKIVSFYCETVSKDNGQAKQIFGDSFRGFKFYVS